LLCPAEAVAASAGPLRANADHSHQQRTRTASTSGLAKEPILGAALVGSAPALGL